MRKVRPLTAVTRRKIDFITKYINRNSLRWFEKYGDQVTGIGVGKKKSGSATKNYYSIVFNVVEKKEENILPKEQIIPKHFKVRFPDGKVTSVKTDVQRTGRFRFHSRIGDRVRDNPQTTGGTLGLILHKNNLDFFGLTNYHVAAEKLLNQNKTSYDATQGDARHDVEVGGSMKRLHKGKFGDDLDVAVIYLGAQQGLTNQLPFTGLHIDNRGFMRGPFDSSLIHKEVTLYPLSQGGTLTESVRLHEAPLRWGILFTKLIRINLCTERGDSGSIVTMNRNKVLGIVIGGDDMFTYIIPYYKIDPFVQLNIL